MLQAKRLAQTLGNAFILPGWFLLSLWGWLGLSPHPVGAAVLSIWLIHPGTEHLLAALSHRLSQIIISALDDRINRIILSRCLLSQNWMVILLVDRNSTRISKQEIIFYLLCGAENSTGKFLISMKGTVELTERNPNSYHPLNQLPSSKKASWSTKSHHPFIDTVMDLGCQWKTSHMHSLFHPNWSQQALQVPHANGTWD